ncbi:hypothetical protein QFC22_005254 [Naganishia vaughanmartiniae]|uniref:Uncharacterized protein n=1 Tax=Naganishia vaughanmartiniae TaxID=1424756 RepID=A0ACC2WXH0_9TREE|nr:hypothetical protein QFC22_005254 [Naganishia vaughanmartiniae]
MVDVAAAGRFITAAIPRAQRLDTLTPSAAASAAATATTSKVSENGETGPTFARVEPTEEEVVREVGKHSRFKLLAQDSVPEKLSVDDGGDDEEIRVVHETSAAPTSRRKGKRVAAEDFLDSPGSEGTKKAKGGEKPAAPAAAASVVEGTAGKTRKSRKSTSKRSS